MDFDPDHLRLTDFLDLATLQEIQDSFAAIANVRATITDAQGNTLTQPAPTREFLNRQRAIAAAEAAAQGPDGDGAGDGSADHWHKAGREYVAPIVLNNQRLGTLRLIPPPGTTPPADHGRAIAAAQKIGVDPKDLRSVVVQLMRGRDTRSAAIQFLHLLANAIARLCFKE